MTKNPDVYETQNRYRIAEVIHLGKNHSLTEFIYCRGVEKTQQPRNTKLIRQKAADKPAKKTAGKFKRKIPACDRDLSHFFYLTIYLFHQNMSAKYFP